MKNLVQRASRLALATVMIGGLGLSSCHKDDTVTVYGNWVKASSFAGSTRRGAVSFVINGTAYVGTGVDGNGLKLSDFYSFTPAAGWTRLTPMPGQARYSAVAFAANGKGYVGTGLGDNNGYLSDFYEFNPGGSTTTTTTTTINGVPTTTTTVTSGSWRRVADLPVNPGTVGRYGAVAASIGNIGYVGCGFDGNSEKDFYTFDPTQGTSGTWTVLNGFPGDKRVNGAAFTIGQVLYVGTGTNNSANVTDFSAYDASAKTWAVKRGLLNQTTGSDIYDYSAVARTTAAAFTIGNYGYIATGSSRQDCYQYDPSQDIWTKMNPFLGNARNYAVAFTIGSYGYLGTGANSTTLPYDDFYQFDPTTTQQ